MDWNRNEERPSAAGRNRRAPARPGDHASAGDAQTVRGAKNLKFLRPHPFRARRRHNLEGKIATEVAMALATTKMSSRGQVVIPLAIRQQMGLREGDEFIVMASGDSLMLKVIETPSTDEFKAALKRLRTHARRAGLKRSDIPKAIKEARETL
jgi:AbrB family looped-hinge helix DNA binding protein